MIWASVATRRAGSMTPATAWPRRQAGGAQFYCRLYISSTTYAMVQPLFKLLLLLYIWKNTVADDEEQHHHHYDIQHPFIPQEKTVTSNHTTTCTFICLLYRICYIRGGSNFIQPQGIVLK